MQLKWVTIKVSNMERSLLFYTKLLNLEISDRFDSEEHQIAMLGKAEDAKVELICEKNVKIKNPGNGISFGLEADDLDCLIDKLKEQGETVSGPISPNPHIRFFFVKDPDGYNIQLIEQL